MNNTPRTDAASVRMERLDGDIDEVVSADFARQLERELIAAQKTINQIKLEWEPAPSATAAPSVWTCVYNGLVEKPCKVCDCEMKGYAPQAAPVEEGAIEPTEEMVTKGVEAMIAYIFNDAPGEMLAMDGRREAMRHAYIAMIKAQRRDMKGEPVECGYNRTGSLNEGRYVCTCGACMNATLREGDNK